VDTILPTRSTIDVAETTATSNNIEIAAIAIDWKEQDEKLNEALEVADAETAKTDHTLWFKKTGWAEHIAGCTLKHLSQASRLPDRDEQTLHEAVKLNGALIEKCVTGLSSLDNETRRWLRSAKHSEIDQRPLARLQNVESQQTYAVYMARLLSFITLSTVGPEVPDKNTPPPFEPGLRFYLAFSALATLSLVIALDGTSISVALPVIADELNGTAMEAFWSGTSFLLSCTVFQPVYATFSHIFGRKALALFAVILFPKGTIISALSHDMTLMLIGRTVQGAGGSGIIALTNVLITDLVPLRNRGN